MNTPLSDELLERLATLSQLDLESTDKTALYHGLEEILSYVGKINELHIDDNPPAHVGENISRLEDILTSPLRKDIICLEAHPEHLLSLAPKQSASYYIVPNTFNGE